VNAVPRLIITEPSTAIGNGSVVDQLSAVQAAG
jgi:hypothetical protein